MTEEIIWLLPINDNGDPPPQIILATGLDPYGQKNYSGLLNSVILGYFRQFRLVLGNLG